MKPSRDVHVYPRGKRWAVRRAGNQRATWVCDSRDEALTNARRLAWLDEADLFIFGPDGRIETVERFENE